MIHTKPTFGLSIKTLSVNILKSFFVAVLATSLHVNAATSGQMQIVQDYLLDEAGNHVLDEYGVPVQEGPVKVLNDDGQEFNVPIQVIDGVTKIRLTSKHTGSISIVGNKITLSCEGSALISFVPYEPSQFIAIDFRGNDITIENCRITPHQSTEFSFGNLAISGHGKNILIEGNRITHFGSGIVFSDYRRFFGPESSAVIKSNIIRGASGTPIHITGTYLKRETGLPGKGYDYYSQFEISENEISESGNVYLEHITDLKIEDNAIWSFRPKDKDLFLTATAFTMNSIERVDFSKNSVDLPNSHPIFSSRCGVVNIENNRFYNSNKGLLLNNPTKLNIENNLFKGMELVKDEIFNIYNGVVDIYTENPGSSLAVIFNRFEGTNGGSPIKIRSDLNPSNYLSAWHNEYVDGNYFHELVDISEADNMRVFLE